MTKRFEEIFKHLINTGNYNKNIEFIFMKYYNEEWTKENAIDKIQEKITNGEYRVEIERMMKRFKE